MFEEATRPTTLSYYLDTFSSFSIKFRSTKQMCDVNNNPHAVCRYRPETHDHWDTDGDWDQVHFLPF